MIYTFLLLFGIFLGVIAQLSLKNGMNQIRVESFRKEKLFLLLKKLGFNRWIVFGFFLYGFSMLLWLVILSKLELSYAYPMVSLGYFFVALGSIIFFKEKISWQRWVSIAIIVVGVVVVGLS